MASMAAEHSEPPKVKIDDHIMVDGDFATTFGEMTMKEKDGKSGFYSYCDVYRFRNDKIAEIKSFVIKTEPKEKTSSATK